MPLLNIISAKRKKIIMLIIFLLAFFVISCQFVVAADKMEVKDTGLKTTAGTAFGPGKIPFEKAEPASVIGQIVGAVLAFVGILFFVLMIYGGFTWMIARGNEQQVTKAKDLIYSAVIGLIIVIAAYAITAYIGGVLLTLG